MLLFSLLLAPGVAGAETCPPYDQQVEKRADLMADLRDAPDEMTARRITGELWQVWLTAPDQRAKNLLDEGMSRREMLDLSGAIIALDTLIAYCPSYAEGWNQRAFARFLQGDYDGALTDLDRALAISPDHIGARSGKALSLLGLGRTEEAQGVLRDALALNPWLPERHLLENPPGERL